MTRKTGDGVTAEPPAPQAGDHKSKRTRPRRDKRMPFELAYPDCAGIDVGSASHFVSVPPDRDAQPVREFKSFTDDLNRMADWLASCGIRTVVMESTGVYWIALYELLESRGFDLHLVNARHVKNVSGRKSVVAEHAFGMTCWIVSGSGS